jgi:enoyl-CoA hydratase/carnithine racemase
MSNSIELKIEHSIAWITLNRPEVFNSFNREMALSMQNKLDQCAADASVRVIVITGAGKAFCAGQDLKEVTTPELMPGFRKILEESRPVLEAAGEAKVVLVSPFPRYVQSPCCSDPSGTGTSLKVCGKW